MMDLGDGLGENGIISTPAFYGRVTRSEKIQQFVVHQLLSQRWPKEPRYIKGSTSPSSRELILFNRRRELRAMARQEQVNRDCFLVALSHIPLYIKKAPIQVPYPINGRLGPTKAIGLSLLGKMTKVRLLGFLGSDEIGRLTVASFGSRILGCQALYRQLSLPSQYLAHVLGCSALERQIGFHYTVPGGGVNFLEMEERREMAGQESYFLKGGRESTFRWVEGFRGEIAAYGVRIAYLHTIR